MAFIKYHLILPWIKTENLFRNASAMFLFLVSWWTVVMGLLLVTTSVQVWAHDEDIKFPHNYAYLINHPELCDINGDIQLLIMVPTTCSNFESRLTVRRTWGSLAKRKDTQLLFLLGSPTEEKLQQHILDEDRTFGDILQEDFMDTYYNLTLKSIMMIKWVSTFCPRARYVLKIDDDCFLNPNNLLAFIKKNVQELAVFGHIRKGMAPHRLWNSKYYMPYAIYPYSTYPDYADGPSYLMTQKAVRLLYAAVLTTKPIFLEDVYLNGICAEKAKIPRIHDPGFYVPSSDIWNVKVIRQNLITSHKFSSHHLRLFWWLLHDSRMEHLDYLLPPASFHETLSFMNSS